MCFSRGVGRKLKQNLEGAQDVKVWEPLLYVKRLGWIHLTGLRTIDGLCGHDNETSVSIEGQEFLDYLNNYYLFKKDFAPCNYLTYSIYSCCFTIYPITSMAKYTTEYSLPIGRI
jgi:hypothetical protein